MVHLFYLQMTQWKIKSKKYNPFVGRGGNWQLEGLSE